MKRIIDIPEKEIKRICENGVVEHIYLIADAIKDSIPLSECRAEDCISREDTYNTMRLMMDNATIARIIPTIQRIIKTMRIEPKIII